MGTIAQLQANINQLDLGKIAMIVVEDFRETIVDINKEQLQHGKRKDSSYLPHEYASDYYANMKHRMNPKPPYGIPDLKATGAFYDGFKLKILSKGEFDIYSTDGKSEMLRGRYGGQTSKDIFGLNSEGRQMLLNDGFEQALIDRVKFDCKL
jgi:hypothetical protein